MRKKFSLVLVSILVVGTFYLALSIVPDSTRAATLYVGGSGPGNYTTIQSAVDAAFPGDTVYVYNGTYNENVNVDKTISLVGEDLATTRIDGGGNGTAVNVTADWVNITGFNITSYKDQWDIHAIWLYGADHVSVTGSAISDVRHTAILVQFSNYSTFKDNTFYVANTHIQLWHSGNSTIKNNEFMYGTGVSGRYTYHNMFHNNTIYVGSYGAYFEDSGYNTISNNVFLPHFSSGFFIADGVKLQWSRGDTVIGNNIRTEGISIDLSYCHDVSITNNTVAALHGNGMECEGAICVEGSTNTYIANNNVTDSPDGINLYFSDRNTVDGNEVYDTLEGIVIDTASDYNTVTNNTVVLSMYHGMSLIDASNNVINGNNITHSRAGIYMNDGIANTFQNNDMFLSGLFMAGGGQSYWDSHTISISNTVNGKPVYYWKNITSGKVPSNAGQVFLANCTGVVVENLTMINGSAGVGLGYSFGNVVANNTFQKNRIHALYLQASPDNKIFHNNFGDNGWYFPGYQAWDDNAANQWDDGYPSGGNYWNDYNGSDEFSGPNQDIPGSDGIGDTPYHIKEFGVDRYPLMAEFTSGHPRPPDLKGAAFSGLNDQDITLSWTLSPDDGQGFNSTVEYQIYRGEAYGSGRSGYSLIATLPKGTTEYTDAGAGKGNPAAYFYSVCAFGSNGVTTCTEHQALKSVHEVTQGVSLVSIPAVGQSESVESLLQSVPYKRIWWFSSPDQEWRSVDRSKPYSGDVSGLNEVSAFWIETSGSSSMTFLGMVPDQWTINLRAGWNLIGFPAFDSTCSVADIVSQAGATRIEGFDILEPPYFLRALRPSDVLVAGNGYWIEVPEDTVLVFSNT